MMKKLTKIIVSKHKEASLFLSYTFWELILAEKEKNYYYYYYYYYY